LITFDKNLNEAIMKKLILFSLIVLSNISYGQNFPGYNLDLLLGKELKVKEKSEALQKFGYSEFYTDDSLKTHYDCCETVDNTKYLSLVGKSFKMVSYEAYQDIAGVTKFKVKIDNSETGTLVFDYDPRFEYSFPFEVVGGIQYPVDFYCRDILYSVDKFSGEVSFSSPHAPIEFYKVIKGSSSKTQIALHTYGSQLVLNTKGITILLENGFKIDRPEVKVSVSAVKCAAGYMYSAFFDLNENELKLLASNKITDFRLYIYEESVPMGNKLMEYLKCLSIK
jgi:hypothetical protein